MAMCRACSGLARSWSISRCRLWGAIGQEGASLGGIRDAAGQVEVEPADELAVGGRAGVVAREVLTGGDEPIELLVQRGFRGGGGSGVDGKRHHERSQEGGKTVGVHRCLLCSCGNG